MPVFSIQIYVSANWNERYFCNGISISNGGLKTGISLKSVLQGLGLCLGFHDLDVHLGFYGLGLGLNP